MRNATKDDIARKHAAGYLKQRRDKATEEAALLYDAHGAQRCMGFVDGFDAAIRYLNGLANYEE